MSSAEPGAPAVAVGDKLSHYRLSALLGQGGMGVVYRARDERLKRDVAIKILRHDRITDDISRRRIRYEALALSKLNHPNIQIVHDFDSDRGLDFLVTEYVPGPTLHERLASGPMTANEIRELGGQLADGLCEAHAHGIVHRDLKPENIKITPDGRLKILDFGIARSDTAASDTAATTDVVEPKGIIGTLPYMAPEQVRGDAADARTDIFAAGCVLYEMCTGKRAFGATTTPRLIESILTQTPRIDGHVPLSLRRIVYRCLQKSPAHRYQSAAELANDLRSRRMIRWQWIAVATVAIAIGIAAPRFWPASHPIHSVAVLPLQNLSGDPAQEYFADGMTDALITDLGRRGIERVIARGSMMRYKKTNKTVPEIARELNVDRLVSGAVAREGNRIRVTAELIDPGTEAQLWSERYEADLRNILDLQSELASAIASKIGRTLSGGAKRRQPVDSEAFDAYMRAMSYKYKPTAKDVDMRMQYLQIALRKDPDFALAHAAVAGTWAARIVYQFSSPGQAFAPAKAEAMRALELDPDLAEAHLALAVVKTYMEWDWNGADREFRRAIELDPTSPDIRFQYATLLGPSLGRFDEWRVQMDRCIELDPLSDFYRYFRGRHLMTLHQPEQSIAALREVQRKTPEFPLIHDGLWYAYESTHQYDQALVEATKSFERKNDREVLDALRGAGGNYQMAMRRAADVLAKRSAKEYVSSGTIARMYVYGGDRDQAIAWLQRAYDTRDQGMVTLRNAPIWDSLRGDPRFEQIVRRMNFPP